jgi:hypothetical protein
MRFHLRLTVPGYDGRLPLSSHRGDAGARAAAIRSPGRGGGDVTAAVPILCDQEVTS